MIALTLYACFNSGGSLFAADMTPQQQADARTKVQTAVSLAMIAEAEKDGDALLVAAKMLSTAGPVAKPGGEVKDGNPTMFDVGELVMSAKEFGADAAKADEVAKMVEPAGTTARGEGYWYYSCDSYNNCQWIYGGW
jgi:hypothetical protein